METPDRVLIVSARFYEGISDALLRGATAVLDANAIAFDEIVVPGALEIPAAIAMAIASKSPSAGTDHQKHGGYGGYIALGCVIRGETSHYDVVVNESARALMALTIRHALALGNGILTVENEEQAWDRARADRKDKGGAAARACLDMMALKRQFRLP